MTTNRNKDNRQEEKYIVYFRVDSTCPGINTEWFGF
jgi:hypothetical protein